MKKVRLIANIAVFGLLIFALAITFLLCPDKDISLSERRPLKQFSDVVNSETHPFDEIESYYLDQFPLRDSFRQLKAFLFMDVLMKNDNNDIYKYDGTVIKIEDKYSQKDVDHAIFSINEVIEKLFPNNKVYFSIVPDKHYYASKENGYPALDYEKLFSSMKDNVNGEYIDITGKLNLSDYYTTDSHWSQDKIDGLAQFVLNSMGNNTVIKPENGWTVNTLKPFYGVYYGQSALTLAPDSLKYLTSDVISSMTMTYYNSLGNAIEDKPVYNEEMFKNNDPYDVFLAGPTPLVTVDNPASQNDKELVIFRDSFGSSISPLLAAGYSKTYVIDLRYINPQMLSDLCTFTPDQDVLFMYSTGLINGAQSIIRTF